jgi:hypothetical protein
MELVKEIHGVFKLLRALLSVITTKQVFILTMGAESLRVFGLTINSVLVSILKTASPTHSCLVEQMRRLACLDKTESSALVQKLLKVTETIQHS